MHPHYAKMEPGPQDARQQWMDVGDEGSPEVPY